MSLESIYTIMFSPGWHWGYSGVILLTVGVSFAQSEVPAQPGQPLGQFCLP